MAAAVLVLVLFLVHGACSKALGGSDGPPPTHLHFYFHDKVTGPSPTAVKVVAPPDKTTPTYFGMIVVMDDLLTEGPDPKSKPVGRAQGTYIASDQAHRAHLQTMNIVLTAGPYNGSVLTVLGRNHVFDDIREMTVVGGTGAFRFARGYAQAHTYRFVGGVDPIVEYNVYVYTDEPWRITPCSVL